MNEELEAILREFNARSSLTWSLHTDDEYDRYVDAGTGLDTSITVSLDERDGEYHWALWRHVGGNMAAQEGPYSYEMATGSAPSLDEAQQHAETAAETFEEGEPE